MPHILILVTILYGNSVHTQHIEFPSKASCEGALKSITAQEEWRATDVARFAIQGICVPKTGR